MAEKEKYLSESLIKDKPIKALGLQIREGAITTPKIAKDAVTTSKIMDKSVTPNKLSDDVQSELIYPAVTAIASLDQKYINITNELYNMIESLQVGGVALSNHFGNREDIGITQKTITKAIQNIWIELSEITGKPYITDFSFTISPELVYAESAKPVTVTVDAADAVNDFDYLRIYVDDELVAEEIGIRTFTRILMLEKSAIIKAEGMILGMVNIKEKEFVMHCPFYMGSGSTYTDVLIDANLKPLGGTLEGDYDVVVQKTNDYIFIIIPKSRKSEFRRADMNGYELPLALNYENSDFVVYKSLNRYMEGTYNIDIDINT